MAPRRFWERRRNFLLFFRGQFCCTPPHEPGLTIERADCKTKKSIPDFFVPFHRRCARSERERERESFARRVRSCVKRPGIDFQNFWLPFTANRSCENGRVGHVCVELLVIIVRTRIIDNWRPYPPSFSIQLIFGPLFDIKCVCLIPWGKKWPKVVDGKLNFLSFSFFPRRRRRMFGFTPTDVTKLLRWSFHSCTVHNHAHDITAETWSTLKGNTGEKVWLVKILGRCAWHFSLEREKNREMTVEKKRSSRAFWPLKQLLKTLRRQTARRLHFYCKLAMWRPRLRGKWGSLDLKCTSHVIECKFPA